MPSPASRLRTVLGQLPFSIDDTDAVNAAFKRWTDERTRAEKRNVDLWTYCFIWRYFLVKGTRGDIQRASDVDDLIARTYQKVERYRGDVRNADRYASWVSVVCKNTFLNYTRRARTTQSIDDDKSPDLIAENPRTYHDVGFVRQALKAAIDRLPDYLQHTARLYLLEERSFEEIGQAIDKSVATVRTYKSKAVRRLREDEQLRDYLDPPKM